MPELEINATSANPAIASGPGAFSGGGGSGAGGFLDMSKPDPTRSMPVSERRELRDTMPLTVTRIAEGAVDSRTGIKALVIEGVFQRADQLNANKRIYPRALWERILGDTNLQERLANRQMLGQLDHPVDWKVTLEKAAIVITGLRLAENGDVIGRAEFLRTPLGMVGRTLTEDGVKYGISSRGNGSTRRQPDGSEAVCEDFTLETFDLVADPSTAGAYPRVAEAIERARAESERIVAATAAEAAPPVRATALDAFRRQEALAEADLTARADGMVARDTLRARVEERIYRLCEVREAAPATAALVAPLLEKLQARHIALSVRPLAEDSEFEQGFDPLGQEPAQGGGDLPPGIVDLSNVPDLDSDGLEFVGDESGYASAEEAFLGIDSLTRAERLFEDVPVRRPGRNSRVQALTEEIDRDMEALFTGPTED